MSSSRRGRGHSRGSSDSSTSRASRRGGDPYPLQTSGGRRENDERGAPTQPRQHAQQVEVVTTAGTSVGGPSRSATDSSARRLRGEASTPRIQPPVGSQDINFRLVILQQPSIGAEVEEGPGRMTLGRASQCSSQPLKPDKQSPGSDYEHLYSSLDLPYLLCSCILKTDDGSTAVSVMQAGVSTSTPGAISVLLGSIVRTARKVIDLEGNEMAVFVFDDVSVREKGKFTLEFRLDEARPQSPRLAAVTSDPFDVVEKTAYPGRPLDEILTPLSRHLHEQDVPMYIPPLALIEPGDPPPPGSNPFPVDADWLAGTRTSRRGPGGPST
ncbi:hypothetical protein P7C70_g1408, partial [Phenoliferia sp. Uapishka_3]